MSISNIDACELLEKFKDILCDTKYGGKPDPYDFFAAVNESAEFPIFSQRGLLAFMKSATCAPVLLKPEEQAKLAHEQQSRSGAGKPSEPPASQAEVDALRLKVCALQVDLELLSESTKPAVLRLQSGLHAAEQTIERLVKLADIRPGFLR